MLHTNCWVIHSLSFSRYSVTIRLHHFTGRQFPHNLLWNEVQVSNYTTHRRGGHPLLLLARIRASLAINSSFSLQLDLLTNNFSSLVENVALSGGVSTWQDTHATLLQLLLKVRVYHLRVSQRWPLAICTHVLMSPTCVVVNPPLLND